MGFRRTGLAAIVFVAMSLAVMAQARQPRREVYSGVSSSDGAVFGYLTGVAAVGGGLYEPGWRLRAMVGHGRYSYHSGALKIHGRVSVLEVTPGRQFVRGPFILKLYGGGHFERHDLTPSDPGNSTRGDKLGIKGIGELWVDMGKRTYLSVDASCSTLYGACSAMAKLGWRIFGVLAIGPQLSAYRKKGYQERRAGSFLRVQKGRYAANLGAGYMRKKGGKRAGYGEFSVEIKF